MDRAPFLVLYKSFYILADHPDVIAQREILAAHDIVVAAVDRDQDLVSRAGVDCLRHGGSNLSQQGVGHDDADGTDDEICVPAVDDHRILTGGADVGAGLQHGGRCDAVGAQSHDPQVRVAFFNLLYHGFSHLAALAVYYDYFHVYFPFV